MHRRCFKQCRAKKKHLVSVVFVSFELLLLELLLFIDSCQMLLLYLWTAQCSLIMSEMLKGGSCVWLRSSSHDFTSWCEVILRKAGTPSQTSTKINSQRRVTGLKLLLLRLTTPLYYYQTINNWKVMGNLSIYLTIHSTNVYVQGVVLCINSDKGKAHLFLKKIQKHLRYRKLTHLSSS